MSLMTVSRDEDLEEEESDLWQGKKKNQNRWKEKGEKIQSRAQQMSVECLMPFFRKRADLSPNTMVH
jgi:hypothetical protein